MCQDHQPPRHLDGLVDSLTYLAAADDADPALMEAVFAIIAYRLRASTFDPDAEATIALLVEVFMVGHAGQPSAWRTLRKGEMVLDFFGARAAIYDPGAEAEVAGAVAFGRMLRTAVETPLPASVTSSHARPSCGPLRLIEGGKTQ